jgi:hypothetical protein
MSTSGQSKDLMLRLEALRNSQGQQEQQQQQQQQ